MVDAHDSKSCIARCGGSSPLSGTANRKMTSFDVIFLLAVPEKQSNCLLCVRARTPELCFFSRKNKRGGAQPKIFDEKF